MRSIARTSIFGLARDTRGSAVVEFALISLPLFLFMFGIVEVSRVIKVQNSLQTAVERAARCSAIGASGCDTASGIQSYAASQTDGIAVSSSYFTATSATCGAKVTASMPYRTISLINIQGTLTASSCHPK